MVVLNLSWQRVGARLWADDSLVLWCDDHPRGVHLWGMTNE